MIEVNCSSLLTIEEVVQELRDGLHCIVGQKDPTDEYYQELAQTGGIMIGQKMPSLERHEIEYIPDVDFVKGLFWGVIIEGAVVGIILLALI